MAEESLLARLERQLQSEDLELPPFNPTALELQRHLGDPEFDIARVAELIRQDPALASRTLRMANSAFYGGLTPVETISRAIVRLGTGKIMSLALAAAGAMAMRSSQPLLNEFLQRLWLRSFVSGHGCRWLAEAGNEAVDSETAFLAGLLHDLGELFLLKALERMLQDDAGLDELTPELLHEILDNLHASMGERLMQAWGLPSVYAEIARDHVAEDCPTGQGLLAMVRLCDLALRKAGIGQAAEPELVLAAASEAQILALSEIQLAQFEVALDDAVEMAAGFGTPDPSSQRPGV